MGLIKEVDSLIDDIVFNRYDSNGELIERRGVYGFSKEYEGKLYYVITDLYGRRVKEANQFINVDLDKEGFKKRELAFSALKPFFTFVQLFHVDYKKGFDKKRVSLLTAFLQGVNMKDNAFDLEFKTQRQNSTIKAYYAIYRQFYTLVFGNSNTAFHDKTTIHLGENETGGTVVKLYIEDPEVNKAETCPKYIKHHEYHQILEVINKKYYKRDKIIVMLMYECGLRLGEVLGLTLEDIYFEPDHLGNYRLYLRNRLGDKPYQKAKRLPLGKEKLINITNKQLIKDIKKYISDSRSPKIINKSKIKRENLKTKSVADKVTSRRDIVVNQYLFLSSQSYKPFTADGWGNRLKQIYEEVGVGTDVERKEDGLSHRFRHGFAMELIFRGNDRWQVAEALRHKGISSVEYYWNPLPEDQAYASQRRAAIQRERGIHFDDIDLG